MLKKLFNFTKQFFTKNKGDFYLEENILEKIHKLQEKKSQEHKIEIQNTQEIEISSFEQKIKNYFDNFFEVNGIISKTKNNTNLKYSLSNNENNINIIIIKGWEIKITCNKNININRLKKSFNIVIEPKVVENKKSYVLQKKYLRKDSELESILFE